MTLDEVRAATPDVQWKDHPLSSRDPTVTEIIATDFSDLAGMRFSARVFYSNPDAHSMEFAREEPVANAAVCEAKGIALVTELESHFGAFAWPVKRITGEHLIEIGAESAGMVSGWTDRYEIVARSRFGAANITHFGMRSRRTLGEGPGRIEMNVLADLEKGSCRLKFVMKRGPL